MVGLGRIWLLLSVQRVQGSMAAADGVEDAGAAASGSMLLVLAGRELWCLDLAVTARIHDRWWCFGRRSERCCGGHDARCRLVGFDQGVCDMLHAPAILALRCPDLVVQPRHSRVCG